MTLNDEAGHRKLAWKLVAVRVSWASTHIAQAFRFVLYADVVGDLPKQPLKDRSIGMLGGVAHLVNGDQIGEILAKVQTKSP